MLTSSQSIWQCRARCSNPQPNGYDPHRSRPGPLLLWPNRCRVAVTIVRASTCSTDRGDRDAGACANAGPRCHCRCRSTAGAATLTNGTPYKAGELPLPFTAADMWAYTVLQDKLLPPPKYDHAYNGPVVVYRAGSQADIRLKCKRMEVPAHIPLMGCSWSATSAHPCLIVVADDETITEWGWTRNIVLRHEIAHCSGWPWNHPGAR